jgi:putative Holliday junction resolvase
MGRIIAIDYGKVRTGIAVTDVKRMIAGGLQTLPSQEVIAFLKQYMETEPVDLILLGEPRQMNYQPSENWDRVMKFKKQLQNAFPNMEIKMIDERFTSSLAHRTMLVGGLKKKDRQDKALVDKVSATIILQTYLETIKL